MITTYLIRDDDIVPIHSILTKYADFIKKDVPTIVQELIKMVIEKNAGHIIELENNKQIQISEEALNLVNKIMDKYISENM